MASGGDHLSTAPRNVFVNVRPIALALLAGFGQRVPVGGGLGHADSARQERGRGQTAGWRFQRWGRSCAISAAGVTGKRVNTSTRYANGSMLFRLHDAMKRVLSGSPRESRCRCC
jgi:hypothetical protein